MIDAADFIAAFDLPPEEAIAYLEGKGYAITFDWKEMDARAHQQAFTIAKVAQMDVLVDVRNALTASQESGSTFDEFKRGLEPMLRSKGWWGKGNDPKASAAEKKTDSRKAVRRLRTIYHTNMQSAYNAGRLVQQQAVSSRRPYWQYLAIVDGSTSQVCAGQNGRVYRADDPIWGRLYPPNHHYCRARVTTLSARQVKDMGLDVDDGSDSDWQPAAGFDRSPADPWKPDLSAYPKDLAAAYTKELKNAPEGVSS